MRLSNVLESSRVLPSDVHQQVPFNFVGGSARGESGGGVGSDPEVSAGAISGGGFRGDDLCVLPAL